MEPEQLVEEVKRNYTKLANENPDNELLKYFKLANGRLEAKPKYKAEFERRFTPPDQDVFSSIKAIGILEEYSKTLRKAIV